MPPQQRSCSYAEAALQPHRPSRNAAEAGPQGPFFMGLPQGLARALSSPARAFIGYQEVACAGTRLRSTWASEGPCSWRI